MAVCFCQGPGSVTQCLIFWIIISLSSFIISSLSVSVPVLCVPVYPVILFIFANLCPTLIHFVLLPPCLVKSIMFICVSLLLCISLPCVCIYSVCFPLRLVRLSICHPRCFICVPQLFITCVSSLVHHPLLYFLCFSGFQVSIMCFLFISYAYV